MTADNSSSQQSGRGIAGEQSPIENAAKYSPLTDIGRLEPSLKRRHWTCDVTPGDAHPAAEPLLIGFTAPYCDQRALGGPFDVA
jgi:hypothetical protein